jgi:D-alanine-D-alanine ligase
MKRLRVLVLMDPDLIPTDSAKGYSEQQINEWKTEYDVVTTLRTAGHEVRPLGVYDELKPIRDEIEGWKPHVVFILLEQFHGKVIYDQNVASYLELMRIPYTGCKPRGLVLARGKDLSKTLVHPSGIEGLILAQAVSGFASMVQRKGLAMVALK